VDNLPDKDLEVADGVLVSCDVGLVTYDFHECNEGVHVFWASEEEIEQGLDLVLLD